MAINYEEKKKPSKAHNVILENRRFVTISGVSDIDSFDEQSVILFTDIGDLEIRGTNLHINKLNIDSGEVNVEGDIFAIIYNESEKTGGSFFSRIFK